MSSDDHKEAVVCAFHSLEIETNGATTIRVRRVGEGCMAMPLYGLCTTNDWAPLAAALSKIMPLAGSTK